MTHVLVFGLPGDEKLWIADFQNGTLAPMAVSGSETSRAAQLRSASGPKRIEGIEFAMPMTLTASVAAGHLDG